MLKQVVVVRDDLKLSKGKLSVQVSHASVGAMRKSNKILVSRWEKEGSKKVVLKARNEKELNEIRKRAESMRLKTFIVKDAGLTEVPPGTITCLGIGPDEEKKIDRVTGSLPLL